MKRNIFWIIIILYLSASCTKEYSLISPDRIKTKIVIEAYEYNIKDTLFSSIDIKTDDLDINYVNDLLNLNKSYPIIFRETLYLKENSNEEIIYTVENLNNTNLTLTYTIFEQVNVFAIKQGINKFNIKLISKQNQIYKITQF